ncbi:PDR/VanB family oxidoreductase [Streptomyces sp. NPDC059092]|uniref:PDR/VanB family oxidoreductase n=1 Tax=Streptomyces sp. NPDC059092 TaxID=3346725 RepID=UPI0036BBE7DF
MRNPSTHVGEYSLVVAERVESADDVVSLVLRHPGGESLPSWQPGAHIDLLLDGGLVRHYSLCGDPGDRLSWRIGVLRVPEGRGGSAYVHGALHAGAPVRVRGPRNNCALRPAGRYLFVAGGIGITPVLPMIAAAEERCRAWPAGALRVERFRAKEQPEQEASADADTFEVVLSQTGHTLQVPPGKSVLKAAREAGADVPYSCGEGICGTCETEVLEGEPDHRDSVLSAEERESGETMMICVSPSLGPRLVLDL